MTNRGLLEKVKKYKIVVALRKIPPDKIEKTVSALYKGGIRMVEVTFDQSMEDGEESTCQAIEKIQEMKIPDLSVGAGTVMSKRQVQMAWEAGAEYLLSPNLDLEVMQEAEKREISMVPGAFTPSEIASAWENGAAMVKVFPIGELGVSYVKALAAPLNHIPLLGMGGINEKNLKNYLKIPTLVGVGVGSNILRTDLILTENYEEIKRLAEIYTANAGKEPEK